MNSVIYHKEDKIYHKNNIIIRRYGQAILKIEFYINIINNKLRFDLVIYIINTYLILIVFTL